LKSVLSKEIIAGLIGLAILLLDGGAGARTLTVDDSGGVDFTKIQEAINYASAGDTILVYSGTYNENIIILKPLFLQGVDNGWGKPIINSSEVDSARMDDESPISITLLAGNSTLDGFTIIGDGFAVSMESNNSKITNNTVLNKHFGIQLFDSSNNIIEDNSGLNSLGIYLTRSYNNSINNNFLSKTYGNIENLPLEYMPTETRMTLTVDDSGGADYKKIQDAINNARAGAKILVYSGTYNENVIVNKPLILKGIDNGWGRPIIKSITLMARNSSFDGFITLETINKDYSLEYKSFTTKFVNLALIIISIYTIVMLYIKRDKIWIEISGRAINASKGAIKDLIIGAIKGFFIGFIAGGVISVSMLNIGFFTEGDPLVFIFLLMGAFIGAIVGAIAGLIRDATIGAIAGTIIGIVFEIGWETKGLTILGEYIGVAIIGAIVGCVIGHAVFNANRKYSINGAIICGLIGFGGLFESMPGSLIGGIIFGSFIGGVLGLLVGRVAANKEAIPIGVVSGLIGSAIGNAITGIFFQVEAVYISFIISLALGAIIGGTICLYSGASKHSILCAIIGSVVVGSVTGLASGGAVINGILIMKQKISEEILFYGSVGMITGMFAGMVQARKNAILICAIGGSFSALIAGNIGYFALGGHSMHITLIIIPIAGAIIGGKISMYYGTSEYTILRAILGSMITGMIVGVVGGLMKF